MKKSMLGRKATLLLASSLTVMAGAMIAPALPRMAEAFAEVPQAELLVKLVLTMPALVIAALSPLAGVLIDRIGKIRLFLASMALYAVAGAAGYFLDSIYAILVSRAMLGVGVAGIMTTATTLIGDYLDGDERNRFLGIQGAFMALGGTVFLTTSGLLADLSWRNPFLVYLFSIVVMGMTLLYLSEPEPYSQEAGAQAAAKAELRKNRFWQILVYISVLVGMIVFYFMPVQSPFLIASLGIESSAMHGLGVVLVTLVSAGVSLSYGYLRQRMNFSTLYGICFGMMGLSFVLISLSNSLLLRLLAAHLVAGIGAGLLVPNSTTCLMQMSSPATRGRVIGGMTSFVFLGQFLSPLIAQPLIGWTSLYWGFCHRRSRRDAPGDVLVLAGEAVGF